MFGRQQRQKVCYTNIVHQPRCGPPRSAKTGDAGGMHIGKFSAEKGKPSKHLTTFSCALCENRRPIKKSVVTRQRDNARPHTVV